MPSRRSCHDSVVGGVVAGYGELREKDNFLQDAYIDNLVNQDTQVRAGVLIFSAAPSILQTLLSLVSPFR